MSPPLGGSSGGLPSRVEYLWPQGVLLPLSTVPPPHPCGLSCGSCCLAGNLPLDCVPARLSPVASMAPGDVCYGPRHSLAGLGPMALGAAPAAGPAGWLGRSNMPDPWGVVCCTLYIGFPGRTHVRGIHRFLAIIHRAGGCVWVCCMGLLSLCFLWSCAVVRTVSRALGFAFFFCRSCPACVFFPFWYVHFFVFTAFCLGCCFFKKERKTEKENKKRLKKQQTQNFFTRRRHGLRVAGQCAVLWSAVFFCDASCWLLAAVS